MRTQKSKAWLLLLIVPLGFEGIWRLQHSIDAQRAALSQERDDVLLRSGKLLKVMSLEYAPLLADIYWTRVVQYYGNKHVRQDANLELLWPLLDITTTLDPNLIVAYRFGAAFLQRAAHHAQHFHRNHGAARDKHPLLVAGGVRWNHGEPRSV